MADLGSKAALQSDINAKVTTNGANENTGARVRASLTNILDTIYANKAGGVRDYAGSLVVNPGDLIQRIGVLYYSVAVQFTTSTWGTDSTSFTEIGITTAVMDAALSGKADAANVPAVLDAEFLWDTDHWVMTGVNQFGTTFTLESIDTGEYKVVAASGTPFTQDKTYYTINSTNRQERAVPQTWQTGSQVQFYIVDPSGVQVDTNSNIQVYIRVYQ